MNKILIVVLLIISINCRADDLSILKLPIGIATSASNFTELVPAGITLPYTFSDLFANAHDNQQVITITLSQKKPKGELVTITDFNAYDLPARSKGTLHLKLTIEINENNELFISLTSIKENYSKAMGPFRVYYNNIKDTHFKITTYCVSLF